MCRIQGTFGVTPVSILIKVKCGDRSWRSSAIPYYAQRSGLDRPERVLHEADYMRQMTGCTSQPLQKGICREAHSVKLYLERTRRPMKSAGRIAAAIEILSDIDTRRRPAQDALKDWGLSHRFAGSGDRAAIGNLVFDALRWRLSSAYRMDEETPRAVVLSTLSHRWNMSPNELSTLFYGDKHAPDTLTDDELHNLANDTLDEAPDWVKADVPAWTSESFQSNFDDDWVKEASALAARAPIDLRVNTAKANRDKVLSALSKFSPTVTTLSPLGIRLNPGDGFKRAPNVMVEAGYQKGWFEIQDEASQIAALMVFAQKGEQVLDYCAGAGGKTLALSDAMGNSGQIHAYDSDRQRLAPIYERLKRAGARNVQVHAADQDLSTLKERMDRVLIDAPCTGSGVWRRRPDAKWRLTEQAMEKRLGEQATVLMRGAEFVRKGGYLLYVTCSVFPEENELQVASFLERDKRFQLISLGEVWEDLIGFDKPQPWSVDACSVTLTPAATQTDGFFISVMERRA